MICALARQRALPLRAAHPLLHPKICARNDNPNTVSFYDAGNRLTGITRREGTAEFPAPNRVLTTLTYDNVDRVSTITHTYSPGSGSPSTLATYTYSYNAASEITTTANQDGSLTYTYDNTGQLTGVDASGGSCGATGCDESFSYDVNGNRTLTGYTTGTGNRLTSDGTYNYTYDDNGNMLTKTRISDSQKTEFTWDYRNRLTSVVLKNSGGTILQQTDFTYDAFDRRIIKTHDPDGPGSQPATTTKTLYDGAHFAANAYADFDASDALTMRYLFGPAVDMILARSNASGTAAWYLADHLGTVRDLVNTGGSVLDHISYSAYGTVTAETNPSNGDRFKYTAREYDSETALYYYRARYYDPAAGRFLSNDPIGFDAGDSNVFRYVVNSPVNAIDPTGLEVIIQGPKVDPNAPEKIKEKQEQKKKEYEDKVKAMIDDLKQKSDDFAKLYKELEDSGKKVIIKPPYPGGPNAITREKSKKDASSGGGSDSTIYFDPNKSVTIPDKKRLPNVGTIPPNIVLAHEMKHAFDMANGVKDTSPTGDPKYPTRRLRSNLRTKSEKIWAFRQGRDTDFRFVGRDS